MGIRNSPSNGRKIMKSFVVSRHMLQCHFMCPCMYCSFEELWKYCLKDCHSPACFPVPFRYWAIGNNLVLNWSNTNYTINVICLSACYLSDIAFYEAGINFTRELIIIAHYTPPRHRLHLFNTFLLNQWPTPSLGSPVRCAKSHPSLYYLHVIFTTWFWLCTQTLDTKTILVSLCYVVLT